MTSKPVTSSGRQQRLLILLPRLAIVVCCVLLFTYALSYAADCLRAYAFTALTWQTAQKRAQLALERCIARQNLDEFHVFQEQIAVMQSLVKAIQEGGKRPRNSQIMRDALLQAHLSPDDATAIVRFSGVMSWINSPLFRQNQEGGARAAARVQRQYELGNEINKELSSGAPNRERLEQIQTELQSLDAQAEHDAQEFVFRTRSLVSRLTLGLFLTVALGTILVTYLSLAELRSVFFRLSKAEARLREREAQLYEARKLDAIGRLAAGVAHDFNNLLMVISSATEMILWQMPPMGRQRKLAESALAAAKQGSSLTQQLLAFSRKQAAEIEVVELDRQIEENLQFIQHLVGPNIEVIHSLKAGAATLEVDRTQFSQALLNLAANARDAMAGHGVLNIKTRVAYADEIEPDPKVTHGYVLVEIQDHGVGMDQETKAHMFEPFFTTKEAGRGVGLGLSTVYGIVRRANGVIKVESEPQRGSTFRLYFPRSTSLAVAAGDMVSKPRKKRGETIFLVEDQDALREMGRTALESEGYNIITARTGEDAIELAKLYSGPIHLLLTDVVLGKINGREAAKKIRELHPDVKVIYMSGYAPSDLFEGGVIDPGAGYLQKPCSLADVSVKIRQILDNAAENRVIGGSADPVI